MNKTALKFILFFIGSMSATMAQTTTQALFSSDKTEGCAPVTINFSDLSTSATSGLRYRWTFGNGNISTKKNPQAIFHQPGKYTVSLEVTDDNGGKSTETIEGYITVFKNPKAAFSAVDRRGCEPLTINFSNDSKRGDGNIIMTRWDFGDGNTSLSNAPSHTYSLHGAFPVSLVIIDENRCEDKAKIDKYITVLRTPKPNFEADKRSSCNTPFTVKFSDLSEITKPGDTYLWEFGDGETSTDKNPSHTYTSKSSFDASLTITTKEGCSRTVTLEDYIQVGPPQLSFTSSKTSVCVGDVIRFTNTSIPDRMPTEWDFGDGTSKRGNMQEHSYSAPGTYQVTLKVTQGDGCENELVKPNYIQVLEPPTASFTHDDTVTCKIPYFFKAQSTSTNENMVTWYAKGISGLNGDYFGNTFNNEGIFTVKLVAKNAAGCTDTARVRVHLKPINAVLIADQSSGCVPLTVTFSDSSVLNGETISTRQIDFGDGSSESNPSFPITHTYTETGVYDATLTVFTTSGCSSTSTIKIRVGEKTDPSFSIPRDSFCNMEVFEALNTTPLNKDPKVDALTWYVYRANDYSEADSLKLKIPVKLPYKDEHYRDTLKKETGWFDVALVTENLGCKDTVWKKKAFFVHDPLAVIGQKEYDVCEDDSIIFESLSTGADSVTWYVYNWDSLIFTSTENEIVVYQKLHSDATVILHAYNEESGCVDIISDTARFHPKFDIELLYTGDQCSPANIQFSYTLNQDFSYRHKKDSIVRFYSYQPLWEVDKQHSDESAVFHQFENSGDYIIKLRVTQVETGCYKDAIDTINITGPSVDGEVKANKACPPLPLELIADADPSEYDSLYWLLEDRKVMVSASGTILDSLYMPGQVTDSGMYSTVKLIGVDSNGCIGQKSFQIESDGPPNTSIKVRRIQECSGRNIIFEAEVPPDEADNYTYQWDLGDGNTATGRVENHTYDQDGLYNVVLTISTTDGGCKSTFTRPIDIEKERTFADFSADSIDTDCPPLFVQFRNLSTSPNRAIRKYYWEFGDGTFSDEKNPSKLYLKAGKFTVKLFVEDEWGCSDSVIYDELILVNGPEGEYTFDNNEGCVPLTVNFDSKTERTNFYEWDMGDGTVIENTSSYTHTYNEPGRFIPLLILKDTFGCSYTLPPIDTINVYPYPNVNFTYDGTCINYPIQFTITPDESEQNATYLWEMLTDNGIDTLTGTEIEYTFYGNPNPQVRLTATSEFGCSGSHTETLQLSKFDLDFASKLDRTCVGTWIDVQSLTESDEPIVFTKWIIDGEEHTDLQPSFFADRIGPVDITLIQENAIGCRDTLNAPKVVVGDSVRPKDPEMLRVTVNDNTTIQIDYKRSPALDFDSYLIYKENPSGSFTLLGDESNVENTSFLSYGNNTLDQSYCFKLEQKNTCGLVSDTFTSNTHCTIETQARGDTNRNVVTWSPYIGWDDVETYEVYRKEVNSTDVERHIGTVSGDTYELIDSTVYCNVEYSYKVKGNELNGNAQISFSDTAHAMPIWFYTPPPNKLVRATVEDDLEILIEWDSVENSQIPIDRYILEKSNDGITYGKIYEGDTAGYAFLDKNVLVDDQSYFYQTYAIDECNDTTEVTNYGKTILLNADTSKDQRPELNWSHYEGWTENIEYYSVEIKNPNNTFTEIGTFYDLDTVFRDLITNLNQRPDYCYRIIAYKEIVDGEERVISVSNEDCSPVRSAIFYPNAFTPNNDGLNDFYVTPSMYIKEYHLMIFTRWGEKIFESFDLNENWDGSFQGEASKMDAFMVVVNSVGVDGIRRVHHGTVTLVR